MKLCPICQKKLIPYSLKSCPSCDKKSSSILNLIDTAVEWGYIQAMKDVSLRQAISSFRQIIEKEFS